MKKIFTKEVIIGSCVILMLAILFFGIDYLKGINLFKAANYYYVSYTDVAGLAKSAPVTAEGFQVGLVRDITYEYDNPGHILVELSLDKQLKVPRGTKAVLTTDLLGTASIALVMPKNADYHEVGDHITGVNPAGMMAGVTEELLPGVIKILPKVDSILVSVNSLVADPALTSAIGRLDGIMANIEKSTLALSTTMGNVAPASQRIPGIVGNVDELSKSLAAVAADLNDLSARLKTMPLDSTMRNINDITANLNSLTAQLNSPNSSMGLLLRDPALYNNLNSSAAHLDSILIDVKRTPKRYIPPIKIF